MAYPNTRLTRCLLLWLLSLITLPALAQAPAIEAVQLQPLPGDRLAVQLRANGVLPPPVRFTVDDPPRIVVDLRGVESALPWRRKTFNQGLVHALSVIEAGNRTRLVIDLSETAQVEERSDERGLTLTLSPVHQGSAELTRRIEAVDFRRGQGGEGRLIIQLSDPALAADIHQEGGKLIALFPDTTLPEAGQRLDVSDFATPVRYIDLIQRGPDARIEISASGRYDHLAYQSGATLTIDVKPQSEADGLQGLEAKTYSGEKLSLNFQDIDTRAVLQLLADFTGLNIVVSDSVSGNITLRLKNVPWDQALDIILRTKGLSMRRNGNILLIAPAEEIAQREQLELQARRQMTELEPLRSELIQINYAKAGDIAELLKSDDATLLSERGNVSVDERTNTLLIRETPARLAEIRALIKKLDIPIRQVLIESRIVIASDSFARDLGARLGITAVKQAGATTLATSGSIQGPGGLSAGTNDLLGGATVTEVSAMNSSDAGQPQRLNVNLPVPGNDAGRFALGILRSNALIDLELSALQVEGRGEILSNPRVITSNQKRAVIEQGTEIPYQQAASSGATAVAFKKAVLSLEVTPQITPDERIILDLNVKNDSVGEAYQGVPSIDTKEIQTQVLINNGETVVLGGIYQHINRREASKIPFLGDLPLIGALFRSRSQVNDKNELLIFVTPKILHHQSDTTP